MPLLANDYPTMLGSLTSLTVGVSGAGAGYSVGDIVGVVGDRGRQGVARVANTSSATGLVTFSLEDGGFGYTVNSVIIISEQILAFAEGTETNLAVFQNFQQDLANLEFNTLVGGVFEVGDHVFTYHANNDLKGEGEVIISEQTGAQEGFVFIHVISGNMDADFFSVGNTISANIVTYTNLMATGNLIGWYNAINLETTELELKIGLATINNEFVPGYLVTSSAGFSNTLTGVSSGTGASANIAAGLAFVETVSINDDIIQPYAAVELDATAFGFPEDPTANISDIILSALNFNDKDYGRIQALSNQNPGTGYTDRPVVIAFDADTYAIQRHNTVSLVYNNILGLFVDGEVINQAGTNAKGIIESSNSTAAQVRVLSIRTDFTTGQVITGESTGTTANVQVADFDLDSPFMGIDAVIEATVAAFDGAVTELEVLSSGFGFTHGEMVVFSNSEIDGAFEGVAFAESLSSGKGLGFYEQIGGFLSDNKKLYDGFYYQDFSYDIIAPLQLRDYVQLVKQVVHTAGYALFGTFEKVKSENFDLYNYANSEFSVSIIENILENMTLTGVGDTEVEATLSQNLVALSLVAIVDGHASLTATLDNVIATTVVDVEIQANLTQNTALLTVNGIGTVV